MSGDEYVSTYRPGSPGGVTSEYARKLRARKAGIASGVARRQRSTVQRAPRARTRQQTIALTYKQPGISRRAFDQAFEAEHPWPDGAPDVAGWQWLRGRETAWTIVKAHERWWRKQGQHFAFTNDQLRATMARLGLERCRRQLQRVRGLLARLGYGVAVHVRRGGAEPGNRDFLRFERRWCGPRRCKKSLQIMYVTPPTGAVACCSLKGTSKQATACTSKAKKALTALIAPPSAADDVGPRCAGPGSEDEGGPERSRQQQASRLAYLEAKAEFAPDWLSAKQERELHELRAELGSGHGTDWTASIAADGER